MNIQNLSEIHPIKEWIFCSYNSLEDSFPKYATEMSNSNKHLEEYIKRIVRREVQNAVNEQLTDIRAAISTLEDQIFRMGVKLNARVEEVVEANNESNDKQLMVLQETVNNQVAKKLEEEIEPRLRQMHRYFDEKTLDGADMVTQWRKKVHAQADVKQITSGDAKRDFQSSMFAFTDDD